MEVHLQFLTKEILKQIGDALYKECVRLVELAKLRTPVNTGNLRDSGRVSPPVVSDMEVSVTMSFGDDEVVKYAIPVHERVYVRHITGRSKFLESVILEESSSVLANIMKSVIV